MGGNFNIGISSQSSDHHSVLSLLDSSGLPNCINYPTRVTLNSSAIIALFTTNTEAERVIGNTVLSGISDHLSIVCFVDASYYRLTGADSLSLFQYIIPYTLEAFGAEGANYNWNSTELIHIANEASGTFTKNLFNIYRHNFPLQYMRETKEARKLSRDILRK